MAPGSHFLSFDLSLVPALSSDSKETQRETEQGRDRMRVDALTLDPAIQFPTVPATYCGRTIQSLQEGSRFDSTLERLPRGVSGAPIVPTAQSLRGR